jgi:hypothetical protein
MWKMVEDVLSIAEIQKGCKYEEGEGKLSLAVKHDELVCMVKINKALLEYLGIKEDDTKTDDCIVLYTSCKLRFRVILILVELKVSSQKREINKAKRQLRTLIRNFKKQYGKEWNKFLRECSVIALIVVDNGAAISNGTEEDLDGIRLFYLRNPAADKLFRKKVLGKLEENMER